MVVDKRTFWQRRQSWQRGVFISLALFLTGAVYFAFDSYQYTGLCGQSTVLPPAPKPYECSLGEYLSAEYRPDYLFLLKVILEDFWYCVAAIAFIPALVGYFMDLQRWGKT